MSIMSNTMPFEIGKDFTQSIIEIVVFNLNESIKNERLELFEKDYFENCSEKEKETELDGRTVKQFFSEELEEIDLYEIENLGEEFLIGKTFLVVNSPDGDPCASFILTGVSGQAVYTCAYFLEL